MNYEAMIEARTKEVNEKILSYLPKEEGYQKTVIEAMNYSFRVGGKRLRPFLMQEIYTMCRGTKKIVEPFMAALEMIHTYSLVHDDLPEMDDDELRRGMPTTHKKYGQAMGVLAGDGLLNYAMETAMRAFDLCSQQDNENIIKALQVLFNKSGIYGMIGGQTLDVEAEKTNHELELGELLFIDENKT
ncbi:MAG TPA: polyprenyl synthetase family protein, partial [Lachnospiraceae bacterium]|nr:polyprenyl synthetase family protein [Lachnospiraceae bacterium]